MIEDLTHKNNYFEETPEDEKELDHFNWGAWCFGWFWGIFNKCFKITFVPWIIAFIISLFLPHILGFIIMSGVSIYIGINGNRWAYKNREWGDIEVFKSTQQVWGFAALIMTIFSILVFIFAFHFFLALFSSYKDDNAGAQTEQNAMEQSQNSGFVEFQPNYSDAYIKAQNQKLILSMVKNPVLKQSQTGEEVASYIIKDLENAAVNSNSNMHYRLFNKNTIVATRFNASAGKNETLYLLRFFKKGECNLSQKNCSIAFYVKSEKQYLPIARTYYDNDGNIIHKKIEQTQAVPETTKKEFNSNKLSDSIEDKLKVRSASGQNLKGIVQMIKLANGIYVSTIVNDDTAKRTKTDSELASYMEKLLTEQDSSRQYVLFTTDSVAMKSYDVTTNKYEIKNLLQFKKSEKCSLSEKNCSITIYFVYNDEAYKVLKSYYDDKGKINHISYAE